MFITLQTGGKNCEINNNLYFYILSNTSNNQVESVTIGSQFTRFIFVNNCVIFLHFCTTCYINKNITKCMGLITIETISFQI